MNWRAVRRWGDAHPHITLGLCAVVTVMLVNIAWKMDGLIARFVVYVMLCVAYYTGELVGTDRQRDRIH